MKIRQTEFEEVQHIDPCIPDCIKITRATPPLGDGDPMVRNPTEIKIPTADFFQFAIVELQFKLASKVADRIQQDPLNSKSKLETMNKCAVAITALQELFDDYEACRE